MKVFNEIVMKIDTLETVYEDSYEYDGPVLLCYTEGSESSSTSVDPLYNLGLLDLSREQQDLVNEYYDYRRQGAGEYQYQDVDESATRRYNNLGAIAASGNYAAMVARNQWMRNNDYEINPETGELSHRVYVPNEGAVSLMDLEGAQTAANMELLPQETELRRQLMEEAMSGTDVTAAANRAQSDVQHSYGLARQSARNQAFRNNIDPNSGAFLSQNRLYNLSEATDVAGARTRARQDAETENFNRLLAASNLSSS